MSFVWYLETYQHWIYLFHAENAYYRFFLTLVLRQNACVFDNNLGVSKLYKIVIDYYEEWNFRKFCEIVTICKFEGWFLFLFITSFVFSGAIIHQENQKLLLFLLKQRTIVTTKMHTNMFVIILAIWFGGYGAIMAEDGVKNSLLRYKNNIFIGNNTYKLIYINQVLSKQKCSGIPYTHVVRYPNCFPVYVKDKVCGGLCSTTLYPGVIPKSGVVENNAFKCVGCSPESFVNKRVSLLCLSRKKRYRVVKRTVRLTERCKCMQHLCPAREWKNWHLADRL